LTISYEEVSAIFPDRIVKQWEEDPVPEAWADTLRKFIDEHREAPLETIRTLSSVSPALGLIAAHQFSADSMLKQVGIPLGPGICAIRADHLDIRENIDSVHIKGALTLIPVAASETLLILARGKGHLVPLANPGVAITPTPAIGFRAADLRTLRRLQREEIHYRASAAIIGSRRRAYLAIALGGRLSLQENQGTPHEGSVPGQCSIRRTDGI
jgi:hypothetical protein